MPNDWECPVCGDGDVCGLENRLAWERCTDCGAPLTVIESKTRPLIRQIEPARGVTAS